MGYSPLRHKELDTTEQLTLGYIKLSKKNLKGKENEESWT